MKKKLTAKVHQLAALLALAAMMFTLAACSEPAEKVTVTLFVDFSGGMNYLEAKEEGLIQTKDVTLEYEPTVEDMADLLSQWTGLDFHLNRADVVDGDVYVDWSEDSTLIAGLDDREPKEDFFFYEPVALNWFMLDSLCRTIQLGLPETYQCSVYFTWGNGQALNFPEMRGLEYLTPSIAYHGSDYSADDIPFDEPAPLG